ncbi:hypothetical protein ABZS29_12425 [Kribbella sp. NPDC005582]|uniref:hypothetical protein n=1 Tax=Kribbella sp. NPDC005582 TaxID=3156893 RepID=UPI0033AF2583
MSEIINLSERFRTTSAPGESPRLLFDAGTATLVQQSTDTVGRIVASLAERLSAVTPGAALEWADDVSVFQPPPPVAYSDRETALAAVIAKVTDSLADPTYTYHLGGVGDGAALMLEKAIDEELLSDQYVFVIDSSNNLHELYYWSR